MPAVAADHRIEVLAENLRKLVRRGAGANVSRFLAKLRAEDVALLATGLTAPERLAVFETLAADEPESAGAALIELDGSLRRAVLEGLGADRVAALLEPLPVDDAVFLVDSLPAELREQVLARVDLRDLDEVQTHLTYGDDSAGRIMDSEFFALPETTTVGEAIAAIQGARDVDMIFYLYVVDQDGHLVGVVSLRQLLLTAPERRLAEVMARSVIKARTDTDQEEVAQLAARYDLLAIPVVDAGHRLVGIVTVDDVIDVLKEEATEDFLRMVGTSESEMLYQDRSGRVALIRLPWLLVNLAGGLAAGLLLLHFQLRLEEALFLLAFVPVIMGMGGNVGHLTVILTTRALASGRLEATLRPLGRFLWQQLRVGAVLGVACGVLAAAAAVLLERNPVLGLVVGLALGLAVLLATLNGVLVPALFRRFGVDPAIVSGPLVTTSNDITGILIYFGLASWLFRRLVP